MTNEPTALVAAITAAITSTLAILLFVGVDPQLVGALTFAATAWVGVGAVVLRSRVTPNDRVALTTAEAKALTAPKPREFPNTTNLES